MKMYIIIFAAFLCIHMVVYSRANSINNYNSAFEYIDRKGEVYFKFYTGNSAQIQKCGNIVSIDRVDGNEVYAYANRSEFSEFLMKNLVFEILPHPGDMKIEPQMSDYGGYDPRGTSTIDRYPTYEGYITLVNKFQESYPDICKVFEYGKSIKGRSLMMVRITDRIQDSMREAEPNIFANCTIHGDETTGFVCMLRMIELLCKNYGRDSRITSIVDTVDLWISLLSNPDGTYKSGNNSVNGAVRYNANNVDLNRSFPGPHGSDATLQVESKALLEIDTANQFVMGLDFHGGVEAVLLPWGYSTTNVPELDWWKYIAKLYGNKSGYPSQVASSMYTAKGSRIDWPYWGAHFRSLCIEASRTKLISESQFDSYWNKNKDAILDFLEETNNCLRGVVQDSVTGKGISGVKVFVEKHDNDFTFVYSKKPHGDYYRPIIKGTYNITFSHSEYFSKTVQGVTVENGKPIPLDVKLYPKNTANVAPVNMKNAGFSFVTHRHGFTLNTALHYPESIRIAVYFANGQLITPRLSCNTENGNYTLTWNGYDAGSQKVSNGFYIVTIKKSHRTFTYKTLILN